MSKRRNRHNTRPAPVKSVIAVILCAALMMIVASDIPSGKSKTTAEAEVQTINYIVESPSQGSRP